MMKVLVLGSGSFAGQLIFSYLLEKGYDVHGINRSGIKSSSQWEWSNSVGSDINWYQCNLFHEPQRLSDLIVQINPTHVVDFMGQGMVAQSWQDPRLWYSTNIAEKAYLLQTISNLSELKKYVRASTPEVYGSCTHMISEDQPFNPSTPYAVSHSAIDYHIRCLAKKEKFPYSIGRFSNFYGEGQQLYRVIPRVILSCLTGKKFILDGLGSSTRYFIYSHDIISAITKLLFNSKDHSEYNFSGKEEISIRNLVALICDITNVSFEQIVDFGPDRPGKDMHYRLNCTKAANELQWRSKVDLREGIYRVVSWVERNLDSLSILPWDYQHKT